ncbi:MAG: glucose-1-phosphate adenylyltransferase [Planctomycetales bacterium]
MNQLANKVLTLIMAGGKGSRLEPLTTERAKPAVPFGGIYRIIDFALSNCINSDLRRMLILTQYKSGSLDRHINQGWRFLNRHLNEFIDILPPQQRLSEDWYMGTADAVYQNIYSIEQHSADHILILSGDHIYTMDYREMIRSHLETDADATIGCLPVSLDEARDFGVMSIDADRRVTCFHEKPESPEAMPNDPNRALASTGIYIFKTDFLLEQLCQDATNPESSRDFGKNIIPSIIDTHKVQAFPFEDSRTGEAIYWRDVGTLDAYFEANMDLIATTPALDLYEQSWPIRTYFPPLPPPKFVFQTPTSDSQPERKGHALDSMVSSGCVVSGGKVNHCILSRGVRVNSWATVDDSILLPDVNIGRSATVRRAIIDRGVVIPEGAEVGVDRAADEARGFTVTESGITVVPQMASFEHLPA